MEIVTQFGPLYFLRIRSEGRVEAACRIDIEARRQSVLRTVSHLGAAAFLRIKSEVRVEAARRIHPPDVFKPSMK